MKNIKKPLDILFGCPFPLVETLKSRELWTDSIFWRKVIRPIRDIPMGDWVGYKDSDFIISGEAYEHTSVI